MITNVVLESHFTPYAKLIYNLFCLHVHLSFDFLAWRLFCRQSTLCLLRVRSHLPCICYCGGQCNSEGCGNNCTSNFVLGSLSFRGYCLSKNPNFSYSCHFINWF